MHSGDRSVMADGDLQRIYVRRFTIQRVRYDDISVRAAKIVREVSDAIFLAKKGRKFYANSSIKIRYLMISK